MPTEEPLTIEGDIPVNELNQNGWGIPDADVENAISSLKHAVVRICNRGDDEHSCDDTGDPFSEIGRVVDAKREGDSIRTKVAITDRIAKQKIEDGTWDNKWSPFGHAKILKNGWTEGIIIESLTLVQNPAWDTASYAISASESGIIMSMPAIAFKGTLISPIENDKSNMAIEGAEWTRINDLPDSAFAYIEPCYKRDGNKNARHLPYKDANGKVDLAHLRNARARVNQIKPICKDTNAKTAIKEAMRVLDDAAEKANIGEYKEKGGLEKENGKMDEKDKKTFTRDDVDKAVKAAIDKAKPETDKAIKEAVDKAVKGEQDKAKAETDKAVKAALEKKEMVTKGDADKMVKAALDKEKEETPYTKEEIGKMVKAAEQNAEKRTRDGLEKETVIASIMDVLTRTEVLKEEDKADRLKALTGMPLDTLKAQYEVIAQFGEKLNVKAAQIKDLSFPISTGTGAEKVIGWTEVKK